MRSGIQYEALIDEILTNKDFMPVQRKTLQEFEKYQREEGVRPPTRLNYLYILQRLAREIHKDFRDITKEELTNYAMQLHEQFEIATSEKYIQQIRRFFKWLYDPNDEEFPDIVKGPAFKRRKVSTKAGNAHRTLQRKDLLTAEEVTGIIEAAGDPMYQCLYTIMISSGGRIEREILQLRIEQIKIEEDQFRVQLAEREVTCIEGLYYVKLWLSLHPRRFDPKAFVFFGTRSPKLPYGTVKYRLRLDVEKAARKVTSLKTKKVYCHLFRHTAATVFAGKPGVNVYVMNQRFGWRQGSRMAQVYIHLSKEDVEDVTRIAFGLEPKGKMEAKRLLEYIQVPRKEYEAVQRQVEELQAKLVNQNKLKERVVELEQAEATTKTESEQVDEKLEQQQQVIDTLKEQIQEIMNVIKPEIEEIRKRKTR